jgi:hypothetical protein
MISSPVMAQIVAECRHLVHIFNHCITPLIFIVMSASAYAAQYNCQFMRDDVVQDNCILSTTTSSYCFYYYPGEIHAYCFAHDKDVKLGIDERLGCFFSEQPPTFSGDEALKKHLVRLMNRTDEVKPAVSPGFTAGSWTVPTSPGKGDINTYYKDQFKAPEFWAICKPQ